MKIQTAVVFGGRSVEHEVSVITGMQVIAALNREKYEPVPIYIAKDGVMYSGEEFGQIESYRQLPKLLDEGRQITLARAGGKVVLRPTVKKLFGPDKPVTLDVAVPAVHGTFVEDGTLQGLLELLGLPYTGCDVLASAICMDKPTSKVLLRQRGLPVLPDIVLDKATYFNDPDGCVKQLEATEWGGSAREGSAREGSAREGFPFYPVIVKPANLGSSVGITKAQDRKSLITALELAFSFAGRVLLEPALTPLREVNAAVLGGEDSARASVCEEPIGQDEILSYQDKYQSGGKSSKSTGMSSARRVIPADLSPEQTSKVQALAVESFRALGCAGVVRVDFLMNAQSGEVYVNELNTLPGSMAFYLWEKTGLPFAGMLDEMISLAFARQRTRGNLTFTYNTNLLSTVSFGSKSGQRLK